MGFDLMSNFTQFIGGGSVKLWSSGETVLQWDYRRSPLDGEIYQRKTASGSGTTDPADDTTNYVAASFVRTLALPEAAPITGVSSNSGAIAGVTNVLIAAAINAGVRTKILAATGRGSCGFFAFVPYVAASTCRIELVVDGRTVYDFTQSVGPANNPTSALVPIGGLALRNTASYWFSAIGDTVPLQFRRSFDVWVTPSQTLTANSANLYHSVRGLV